MLVRWSCGWWLGEEKGRGGFNEIKFNNSNSIALIGRTGYE